MSYYSTYGGVSMGVAVPLFVLGCLCWGFMRRCRQQRWKENNRNSRLALPPASSNMAGHENAAYLASVSHMMYSPTRSSGSTQPRDGMSQSDVYVIPPPAVPQNPPSYSECVSPSEPPPPYVP